MPAVQERARRTTAGRRLTVLTGQAAEDDLAFWGHDTWQEEEENDDNDSFALSDEDSELQEDVFDSDFDETEDEQQEEDVNQEAEQELLRQERSGKRKGGYRERPTKKRRGFGATTTKRVMGEGLNSGIVLNVPVNGGGGGSTSAMGGAVRGVPVVGSLPPRVAAAPLRPKRKQPPPPLASLAVTRARRANIPETTKTTRTKKKKCPAKKTPRSQRRTDSSLLSQETLLLEAVNETEPANARWLLSRKRTQQQQDDINVRNKASQKSNAHSTFYSRRGVATTITFSDMDRLPPLLLQQHAPTLPSQKRCVITGRPARYTDPQTNQPYYDLDAFRQLRQRAAHRPSNNKNDHTRKPVSAAATIAPSQPTTIPNATETKKKPPSSANGAATAPPPKPQTKTKKAAPKKKQCTSSSNTNTVPTAPTEPTTHCEPTFTGNDETMRSSSPPPPSSPATNNNTPPASRRSPRRRKPTTAKVQTNGAPALPH